MKIQKNFPQKYSLLYNKLKYLLKGEAAFGKENKCFLNFQ